MNGHRWMICLVFFALTTLVSNNFPCHPYSRIVESYISKGDKHFDKAVGKFVDLTNKHIIGIAVDSDIRKIQIAAVKLAVDPRTEKAGVYVEEIEETLLQKFSKSEEKKSGKQSGSRSVQESDPCFAYFRRMSETQKKYPRNIPMGPIFFEYEQLPIKILECYIKNKQYNLALYWAKECEKAKLVPHMCNANQKFFYSVRDKLEMVIKGADNW